MYSEKVMEHFRNPRNVGEIPDADGIGKVGNPVCVPPETDVVSGPGIAPIYSVAEGGTVLSHDGKFHAVAKKFERAYSGSVIIIKNRLGTTSLTPDHLVYAVKIPKRDKYKYAINKKVLAGEASWWHAYHLEKSDIVAYPILKEVEDVEAVATNALKAEYDFKSTSIPEKIKVNADFMRFSGYFLAEGSTRIERCKTYATLTFNIKEKKTIDDAAGLAERIFGIGAVVEKRENRNTANVIMYNVHVARFLSGLFGGRDYERSIPEFMMRLPLEKQMELIRGLWSGDGYVDRRKSRASYSTVSKTLAEQVKMLLLRQGIISSIYEEKPRVSEGANHRKAYRIFVLETHSLARLARILGIDFRFKPKTKCNAWISNGLLFSPIMSIDEVKYNGIVNNLEVEDAHSYATNSLLVHNCGDLMWIYIKVGKNENGEEILQDIKFKTFGCGAAIATSSMITELAKGKTLEEGMKISRSDVADSLGGLPPIKMHCSNLAADGLHAAILDYFKKQNRPIPEWMQKLAPKEEHGHGEIYQ